VRKPFSSEFLTLSTATKTLTEKLTASKHRDSIKSHLMTEGAELLPDRLLEEAGWKFPISSYTSVMVIR